MLNIADHDTARSLIAKLHSEMVDNAIWETVRAWGETAETGMLDKARVDYGPNPDIKHPGYPFVGFASYDLTMMAVPSIAKRINTDSWITGYQFTISHEYLDLNEVKLGMLSETAFLEYNDVGKITALHRPEELTEVSPSDKPN